MSILTGTGLTISINAVDYTSSIVGITENNVNAKEFATIKCYSNSFKKVLKGRSDISLTFKFIVDGTNVSTLFESDTAITIIISGSGFVATYTNMIADSLTYEPVIDGVLHANLIYSAPSYDNDGGVYNRVVTTS